MFKKKNNYDILIPKFDFELDFSKLNLTQTKEYFNWYINNVDKRVEYLSVKCAGDLKIEPNKLNLAPESLKLVWQWFLNIAKTERTPKKQLKQQKIMFKDLPKSLLKQILTENKIQFTLQTEYIIRDIAMYIAKVFLTHYPFLEWGYYTKPKSDIHVNRPVILGFKDFRFNPVYKPVFEPVHMVAVQASKIYDKEQQGNDLFLLYSKWTQFCVSQ